jgi:hypothetical protein
VPTRKTAEALHLLMTAEEAKQLYDGYFDYEDADLKAKNLLLLPFDAVGY